MSFFDRFEKSKGGYIFLSHSHDDIEKVREIRNDLEKEGFEPLCFYLKCLENEEEIEDLIKREIDAREWFIFLDSPNSRNSRWVTLEREYIKRTDRKKILVVDLENKESLADAVYKISHNLRVFISASMRDEPLAQRIKERLQKKDYLVFLAADSISTGISFLDAIEGAIVEASRDGAVIVLITPNSLRSNGVLDEVRLAFEAGGRVIPVFVGNVEFSCKDEVSRKLAYYSAANQSYRLTEDPTDDEIDEMIDRIGRAITG